VEARPGREGGIGVPRTHDVQGDFGIGEEPVPEVVREVRMGGGEDRDEVIFACPYCPLQDWICGFVGAQTSQATAARESTLGTLLVTRSHCQQ
jgi:hypothetical protein